MIRSTDRVPYPILSSRVADLPNHFAHQFDGHGVHLQVSSKPSTEVTHWSESHQIFAFHNPSMNLTAIENATTVQLRILFG